MPLGSWKSDHRARSESLLRRLSGTDALAIPCLIGALVGAVSGLVMVAFQFTIERLPELLLHLPNFEDFEALTPWERFLLPTAGGFLIGLFFQSLAATSREVGVVHVFERLHFHDGDLPLRNAVVQFVGAAASLICGHSAGREGPAIHIGAACASWIGQRFHLPNNGVRIMVGCGSAGAIAASFDTPLAGVIFAMEVILEEYTLSSFAPIILAAVSATAVNRTFFGAETYFGSMNIDPGDPVQLAYALAIGLSIGLIAALLVKLLAGTTRHSSGLAVWLRLTLAGIATGCLALAAPEIMGIGYDTINATMAGEIAFYALLLILVCKVLATGLGLGLGLPGGIIGPTLVIGAVAGGVLGQLHIMVQPTNSAPPELYAMLGTVAMMGATLHAPLAALTALLELSGDPNMIYPGMLAVISAYLVNRSLLRTKPLFEVLASARGISLQSDPLSRSLRRLAVARAMSANIVRAPTQLSADEALGLLSSNPQWILIESDGEIEKLMPAAELARQLERGDQNHLDLLELPLKRMSVEAIAIRSTLTEALRRMDLAGIDGLYVTAGTQGGEVLGVLTRSDIERCYRT
jgi:H+/Cl- antiporter ClcA